MTDEEMAREYADSHKMVYGSDEYDYITDYNNIKRAFLAGLKAGSQLDRVWHDYDAGEDCYEDSHEGRWVKREAGPQWHKVAVEGEEKMNHANCRRKKNKPNRLFELFRKHNKAQNKREEELDRLYKAIDGGE